jgi:hypothetical protein
MTGQLNNIWTDMISNKLVSSGAIGAQDSEAFPEILQHISVQENYTFTIFCAFSPFPKVPVEGILSLL